MDTATPIPKPHTGMSEAELRRLAELRLANLAKGRAKLAEKRKQGLGPASRPTKEPAQPSAPEPATDDPIYHNQPVAMPEPTPQPPPQATPSPVAPVSQPIQVPQRQPRAPKAEPDYKQEYYKQKLSLLQKQQAAQQQQQQQQLQQAQFVQSYAQMPPYNHAIDIARNSLRKKADDAMLKKVWQDLFH